MPRIVVALGGNALGDSPKEQRRRAGLAARPLVDLVKDGHSLVVCHGNGPQVGMIEKAFSTAHEVAEDFPLIPLAEATAMSQGYIGYHIQQALDRELEMRGIGTPVVTVVTEVVVGEDDVAFTNPTKPIGAFVDEEQARELAAKDSGAVFKEDAGRGWRQFVASPKPVRIAQGDAVKHLVESGFIVVAAGGGGVPVARGDRGLRGVDAVIDKDLSAALLAERVGASTLVILTAVKNVAVNWGKPNQTDLDHMSAQEAQVFLEAGEFAEGSMKPKVEAALNFVRSAPGRRAVIGSLEEASGAVRGISGTIIEL